MDRRSINTTIKTIQNIFDEMGHFECKNKDQLLCNAQLVFEDVQVFATYIFARLGFEITDIQLDILRELDKAPDRYVAQAGRGEGKTLITATRASHILIHNPKCRIMAVGGNEEKAKEISYFIINIFKVCPELNFLLPDTAAGDRAGVASFDLHSYFRGFDKTPSVACYGIQSNITGSRADVVIADDIENKKNSRTATSRGQIAAAAQEFTAICDHGQIVYLGTPHSIDSYYNTLAGRGYQIHIWPARYPTKEEQVNYVGTLAPLILRRMQDDPGLCSGYGIDGTQGAPVDTKRFTDEELIKKEIDLGKSDFKMQYMLDTSLLDEDRYPLKLSQIIVMPLNASAKVPGRIYRNPNIAERKKYTVMGREVEFSTCLNIPDTKYFEITDWVMRVDPAGGGKNGDETSYAIIGELNSTIFVLALGGIPGGYTEDSMQKIVSIAKAHKVSRIIVEDNYGNGAFRSVLQPVLLMQYPSCGLYGVTVHGQKELRIIETLEPIIGRGSLVFNEDIILNEDRSVASYPSALQTSYSGILQIKSITRDRGSLEHDDRVDALAGACEEFVQRLKVNQEDMYKKNSYHEFLKRASNPFGDYSSRKQGQIRRDIEQHNEAYAYKLQNNLLTEEYYYDNI